MLVFASAYGTRQSSDPSNGKVSAVIMQNSVSHERLHALDGLRALMLLLGLVLHSLCSYTVTDLGAAWPYKDSATHIVFDAIVLFIHEFRMPVFFVLAGFFAGMIHSRRGALGLLHNRWRRIGIPFIVLLPLLWPIVGAGFEFANVNKTSSAATAWHELVPMLSDPAFYIPQSTMHLWFIYYLIQFYLIALVLLWASRWLPAVTASSRKLFSSMMSSPVLRFAIPVSLTTLMLLPMNGELATSTTFTPNLPLMALYFVFFGFGWLLYHERHRLQQFCTAPLAKVLIAIVLFAAMALYLRSPQRESAGVLADLLLSVMGAAVAWLMFYGTAGFFQKLTQPSVALRWLVDASYWVYLVHLPIAIWMPALLATASMPSAVKASLTLCSTIAISFGSYWLFAWISKIQPFFSRSAGNSDLAAKRI